MVSPGCRGSSRRRPGRVPREGAARAAWFRPKPGAHGPLGRAQAWPDPVQRTPAAYGVVGCAPREREREREREWKERDRDRGRTVNNSKFCIQFITLKISPSSRPPMKNF